MRKIIIIFIGVILLISVILLVLLFHQQAPNSTPGSIPTPSQYQYPPGGTGGNGGGNGSSGIPLQVETITPANNTKSVSLNQVIYIGFNRSFRRDEISLSSFPVITFTQNIQGQSLILSPRSPLTANTQYTLYITSHSPQQTFTFTFSTIGDNPTQPNTYPGIGNSFNKYAGDVPPDVFLANRTPYDANTYALTSRYNDSPPGNYYFIVQLYNADPTISKQDFLTWVHSIGLSDDILSKMDIRYILPPSVQQ